MSNNIILIVVSFALMMEAIDTTVLNTAIPVMAQNLAIYPIDLKLALISYLLSLAIFIPISGWIADKYGAKKVFIIAIALFTLSSIGCGLSNQLYQLVAGRILQGVGGAFTMPIGRLIIVKIYKRHELISKMTIVVVSGSLGLMLGPLIGGFITTNFSWRWIFWINVPIGLFAMLLAARYLPRMETSPTEPLDKLGFILFGSGLATLLFGLSAISEAGASHTRAIVAIIVSMILLFLYAWHSRYKKNPILNIELFKIRTFRISVIGNILSRVGFGGIPFLIPLLLQLKLGYSAQSSGVAMAPVAIGVLLIKFPSRYILKVFGYKNVLIFNTLFVGISLWSLMFIEASSSMSFIACLMFAYGFIISLQYTAMNSLAYANLSDEAVSSATSIMSTIQQVTQSFGVASAAILLAFFSGHFQLTLATFHKTFFIMGFMTVLSGLIFSRLKKEDGRELIEMPSLRTSD